MTDQSQITRLRGCVMFFASVIKSGEPWTTECQREMEAALDPPRAAIGPHSRFDHDGLWPHHHDSENGEAVWWINPAQEGPRTEHRHGRWLVTEDDLRQEIENLERELARCRDEPVRLLNPQMDRP